jgi:hypothetical protein
MSKDSYKNGVDKEIEGLQDYKIVYQVIEILSY